MSVCARAKLRQKKKFILGLSPTNPPHRTQRVPPPSGQQRTSNNEHISLLSVLFSLPLAVSKEEEEEYYFYYYPFSC